MSRRTALDLGAALALGAGLAVLPGQARAATVVVDTTACNSRSAGGTLPATTFLTTGSTTIGATMN
ncbi:hypothetical protein ACICHK_10935 [Streptomyces sp. AHU1]|uniref:hypothetical protein n=1 Tax=Streptomyces sp. AHU1 TaxID=3377215 RepID=UPI0038780336